MLHHPAGLPRTNPARTYHRSSPPAACSFRFSVSVLYTRPCTSVRPSVAYPRRTASRRSSMHRKRPSSAHLFVFVPRRFFSPSQTTKQRQRRRRGRNHGGSFETNERTNGYENGRIESTADELRTFRHRGLGIDHGENVDEQTMLDPRRWTGTVRRSGPRRVILGTMKNTIQLPGVAGRRYRDGVCLV